MEPIIVVGVDGSDHSAHALEWAIREARAHGTRLRVVTTWQVPAVVYGAPGLSMPDKQTLAGLERGASDIANSAAERARSAGVQAEVLVKEAQAADALIDAAEDADLLVVGSRGHGGFTGLLLGSVSAQCAHHAACPVTIIREQARRPRFEEDPR
jgi:nucleotide-binding universal stress UspA family protein